VRAQVLQLDLELLADPRQLVGQEHVCRGRQLVEDVEALGRAEVERHAALAAVRVFQERVHVAADGDDARRRQAAHGVAALGGLHLDHLGAPVGQQRRGRRHERVLCNLEDADALHHCGRAHRRPSLCF